MGTWAHPERRHNQLPHFPPKSCSNIYVLQMTVNRGYRRWVIYPLFFFFPQKKSEKHQSLQKFCSQRAPVNLCYGHHPFPSSLVVLPLSSCAKRLCDEIVICVHSAKGGRGTSTCSFAFWTSPGDDGCAVQAVQVTNPSGMVLAPRRQEPPEGAARGEPSEHVLSRRVSPTCRQTLRRGPQCCDTVPGGAEVQGWTGRCSDPRSSPQARVHPAQCPGPLPVTCPRCVISIAPAVSFLPTCKHLLF